MSAVWFEDQTISDHQETVHPRMPEVFNLDPLQGKAAGKAHGTFGTWSRMAPRNTKDQELLRFSKARSSDIRQISMSL